VADWKQVKSIFEELVELSGADREASIGRLCDGDPALRAEVDRLLASHDDAGRFMGAPTLEREAGGPKREGIPAQEGASKDSRTSDAPLVRESLLARSTAGIPSRSLPPPIGPYTPLEVIGEGGFGTVYRAQQDSPVQRIVGLKVIKLGMDTREVIARFESERQALAIMSHPNIAAVFDAGATAEGRPYFVMEYVPGEPITAYCDRRRLGVRERLELFKQVCYAIQHAHQKGVIHRDIKPSNVLVISPATANAPAQAEQPAIIKVIDFGIAKAAGPRLSDQTVLTQEGVLVGTPEFMSPEQADPGQLDIDTRTDIYSLGALLYALLTGTLPLGPNLLRTKGFAEVLRIVREVEPARPSTRVGSLALAPSPFKEVGRGEGGDCRFPISDCRFADGTRGATRKSEIGNRKSSALDIAQSRRSDPRSLARTLRGDLDWIVMKCLEKDRARRYQSAGSLALEVERYLRGEPVLAGPPGAGYRLHKFVRRNRVAIGVVAVISVALVVSITGLVAAVRARDVAHEQREVAQRSSRAAHDAAVKAEAVNRFLQEMLSAADPRFSARRELTVRESLDRAVAKLDAGAMSDQPEIEAAVRLTIGRSYAGLAQFEAAEVQVETAIAACREFVGEDSPAYAQALHERGCVRKLAGRPIEAEADLRAALAIQRARGEEGAAAAATCANDLALALLDQKRLDDAEPLLAEVLSYARQHQSPSRQGSGRDGRDAAATSILAEAINNMGSLHLARGEFAAAEPLFREAIEVNRQRLGKLHPSIATNLDNLAQALQGKGDLAGAENAFSEAIAIRRELLGAQHPELATSLHNLAVLQFARGNREACETALRESLAIFRETYGPTHSDTLTVLHSLVSVVGGSPKPDEAETLLLEAFEAVRDDPAVDVNQKRILAERLVQLYQAWARADNAAEWARRADALRTPPRPARASATEPSSPSSAASERPD